MIQQSTSHRKFAFTLIELIVALVLGTLLLTVIMGVLRRSFAELGIAASDDPSSLGRVLLSEQFRRDLTNARRIELGDNRFAIEGFLHRDPVTLIATQRPAKVIYEVRQTAGQSLLVRIQTESGHRFGNQATTFVEPVYAGVGRLIVASNEMGILTNIDPIELKLNQRSGLVNRRDSLPSSVKIILLDQRGRTILDQVFLRQQEG